MKTECVICKKFYKNISCHYGTINHKYNKFMKLINEFIDDMINKRIIEEIERHTYQFGLKLCVEGDERIYFTGNKKDVIDFLKMK